MVIFRFCLRGGARVRMRRSLKSSPIFLLFADSGNPMACELWAAEADLPPKNPMSFASVGGGMRGGKRSMLWGLASRGAGLDGEPHDRPLAQYQESSILYSSEGRLRG